MNKRDLLRKLRSVRSAERGIVPDQAWVLRTRARLMEQTQDAEALSPLPKSLRFREAARVFVPTQVMSWVRTPALAAFSIVVAVLGGSLASVNASDRSVPGDFLYPVKIASEQTRLALTQGKADRVRLKTEFVDRRVEEIKTIANTPSEKQPERLREAAMGLKRDLDTVKNQLKEVEKESSAPVTAELAKLVDEKIDQVSKNLKELNTDASQAAKPAVAEAAAQAVQTSVAAVAVLIEARTQPDAHNIISDEDVAQVLREKLSDVRESVEGVRARWEVFASTSESLFTHDASEGSTTSSTVTVSSTRMQFASASATLVEIETLINENKLDEATKKLADAAKTASQAIAAAERLILEATPTIEPTETDIPDGSASSSEGIPTTSSTSSSASPSTPATTSTPPT